jgi:hypothetical protein
MTHEGLPGGMAAHTPGSHAYQASSPSLAPMDLLFTRMANLEGLCVSLSSSRCVRDHSQLQSKDALDGLRPLDHVFLHTNAVHTLGVPL